MPVKYMGIARLRIFSIGLRKVDIVCLICAVRMVHDTLIASGYHPFGIRSSRPGPAIALRLPLAYCLHAFGVQMHSTTT